MGAGLWVGRGDQGQLPVVQEGSCPDAVAPCHEAATSLEKVALPMQRS